MIEKIIYDYLKLALDVPVFMEIPENEPTEFVVIEKTGSSRFNLMDKATLAVQSYSNSLYKTAVLNEIVKSKMFDSISVDQITSCKLNSDYNQTDTQFKRYRYQAVFDIAYYND